MLPLSPIAMAHIAGGLAAVIAGPISLLAPKGRWLHRKAGTVFYYAMLVMAAFALLGGMMKGHKVNLFAASLTLYLVVTSWSIVKTRMGTLTRVERWAPWVAAVIAIGAAGVGAVMTAFPGVLIEGDKGAPPNLMIFGAFALIATLAAGADLWTIRRGGLKGAARISRHLWRMCLALFIGIGSFAVQAPLLARRMDLPPPPSLSIFGPALAVLVLMAFWLIQVRLSRRFKAA